jgi:CRP-like cAMP-binding protein
MSGSATIQVCHVLREDRDLAEAVDPAHREQAIEECTARELTIPTGRWSSLQATRVPGGLGLLVLRGVMIRRVGISGRHGAELLGECDVLRPWQPENESLLPLTTSWWVLEPAHLAVLDDQFARLLARYPELAGRLFARAVERSRNLAINMAIVHQARVDVRLHMLLWHLAGRWGRVRSDGTVLPLRLTHTVLADLVAARRPTVTTALSELSRRGLVRSLDDRWVLYGEPPRAMLEMSSGPWRGDATAGPTARRA